MEFEIQALREVTELEAVSVVVEATTREQAIEMVKQGEFDDAKYKSMRTTGEVWQLEDQWKVKEL